MTEKNEPKVEPKAATRPFPVVADGHEFYFNNQCFRGGAEMRNLPDEIEADALARGILIR